MYEILSSFREMFCDITKRCNNVFLRDTRLVDDINNT